MMPEEAWLLIRGVEAERWSHPINTERHTIGRSIDCGVSIPHGTISRRHAEIWRKSGTVYVRDLNSLNGTFVDGVRIAESAVAVGAELRVGRVKLDIVSNPSFDDHSSIFDLDAEISGGPATITATPRTRNAGVALTFCQRQVMKLLLTGLSEKLVASALSISRQTVHTHVKEIYRQMNVHSRAELMALFISDTFEWEPSAKIKAPRMSDGP